MIDILVIYILSLGIKLVAYYLSGFTAILQMRCTLLLT